ncbi:MAG TPA: YgiT-type zinc finger protein [Pyrinomonadaceae bacterium]|jgi:YgiT-type zinc finger domain-containing protein|nr:YgiT-type zinc finger protein [Pyrinomonadaceae bacterium]
MNTKLRETICDNCGKNGARIIHVTKSYGKGVDLLVIENVPIVSCPHCGESYLTAKTLREIENIKRNRTNIAVERPVPVAVFA